MNSRPESNLPLELECVQLSDVGLRRANNQDSLSIRRAEDHAAWSRRGHLLVVADGMGAHAAGETASRLAVENVTHHYFNHQDVSPAAALREAIRETNRLIHSKGESALDYQGMGTTCTCLAFLPSGALVAHVGDSRAYRLRGDVFEQLTFDHSLVWEMAAAGHTSAGDLPSFIPKNVITRSLGPRASVLVDLEGPFETRAGDVFLLCTDGLTGQVSDEELGAVLRSLAPDEAAQTLVDLAILRGGPDNVSLIVARVPDAGGHEIEGRDAALENSGHEASSWGAQTDVLAWLAIGLSLVTLVWCIVQRYPLGALLSALALGFCVAMALMQRRAAGSHVHRDAIGGPYGNAPYRTCESRPARPLADALKELVVKLREFQATHRDAIDWQALDEHAKSADAAAALGDFEHAVRDYSAAIRITLQRLRDRDIPLDQIV